MTPAATARPTTPTNAHCCPRVAPLAPAAPKPVPGYPEPANRRAREKTGAAAMPTCATCHATWSGQRPCHCAGCHRTFSGIELFDRHRHHRGEHGGCLDPATLTGCEHRDGMWRGPEMDPGQRARFEKGANR